MTKKDYIQFADMFSKHHHPEILGDVIIEMAAIFKADNPNFDRDRFYKACNYDPLWIKKWSKKHDNKN